MRSDDELAESEFEVTGVGESEDCGVTEEIVDPNLGKGVNKEAVKFGSFVTLLFKDGWFNFTPVRLMEAKGLQVPPECDLRVRFATFIFRFAI